MHGLADRNTYNFGLKPTWLDPSKKHIRMYKQWGICGLPQDLVFFSGLITNSACTLLTTKYNYFWSVFCQAIEWTNPEVQPDSFT